MATRWACVGPGNISCDFFKAIQENLPAEDHEFVAVASKDLSRAQQFAERFKFKRAYGSYDDVANDEDVEIVYIGTLHTTHAELSLKMLEAGKHVLCEKSMATSYKKAKQVLDLAKAKHLLFVEGIWSRFFPAYDEIRKEITSGSLGEIKLVQANLCFPVLHIDRIVDLTLGGGGLLDLGIYVVQFACLVFNDIPETVSAEGTFMEGGADESACIILKYKNGAVANLTYNCSVPNNNNAVICGTKGMIEVDQPFFCPTRLTSPSGVKECPALNSEGYIYSIINIAGLQYEAKAVRECLLKGKVEHDYIKHADSEMIHKIMDKVRQQIGIVNPDSD